MRPLKRIDNMDLLTRDVERLVQFYHGTLGLDFFLPYEREQGWAAVDLGNLTLYIFATAADGAVYRRAGPTPTNPQGIDSFAFEVNDLDAAIRELDGKVEWAGEVRNWTHPSGIRYDFRAFFDPDGNKLYLTRPQGRPSATSPG